MELDAMRLLHVPLHGAHDAAGGPGDQVMVADPRALLLGGEPGGLPGHEHGRPVVQGGCEELLHEVGDGRGQHVHVTVDARAALQSECVGDGGVQGVREREIEKRINEWRSELMHGGAN
jgi:hypothetical protein